jgi:hypothetical protein
VTRATVRFRAVAAHTVGVSDSLRRVLVALAVVAGLAGIVFAFSLVDTDDGTNDIAVTDAGPVEQLIPPRGSEILRQEAVGVDLRPGWTGVLVVNDVEIPEDQVDDDNLASLGQLLYTPGSDKVIERFEAGENCVTAVVWRAAESRADSRNVSWCFNVT